MAAPIIPGLEPLPVQDDGPSSSLGQEDFLRMLIAQLENQDPLDPQDATQFTAQLAQFSSLEQLVAMRTSIEGLTSSQSEGQGLSAVGLVGREVVVDGSAFEIDADPNVAPPTLQLQADEPTSLSSVEVIDSNGAIVARIDDLEVPAGLTTLDWTRFDQIPGPGAYTFRATPQPGSGFPTLRVGARVTGVSLSGPEATLLLGGSEAPISALREIRP